MVAQELLSSPSFICSRALSPPSNLLVILHGALSLRSWVKGIRKAECGGKAAKGGGVFKRLASGDMQGFGHCSNSQAKYSTALLDLCSTLKPPDSPLIQALVWFKWQCTEAKVFWLVTPVVITSLSVKVAQLSNGLT